MAAAPMSVPSLSVGSGATHLLGVIPLKNALEVRMRAGLPSIEMEESVRRMYPGVRAWWVDFASTMRPVTVAPYSATT